MLKEELWPWPENQNKRKNNNFGKITSINVHISILSLSLCIISCHGWTTHQALIQKEGDKKPCILANQMWRTLYQVYVVCKRCVNSKKCVSNVQSMCKRCTNSRQCASNVQVVCKQCANSKKCAVYTVVGSRPGRGSGAEGDSGRCTVLLWGEKWCI